MSHAHLSDEQLSAHIDGRAKDPPASSGPDLLISISSCDRCRQRLAALEQARALVRLPVTPVSPSSKAAAVREALTAGTGPASAASLGSVRQESRRSRLPLAAAAAVVALALAGGISVALSHRTTPTTSSAARLPSRPAPTAHAPTGAAPTATGAATVPDLGTIGSAALLRARLAPFVKSGRNNAEFGSTSSLSTQSDSNAQAGAPLASRTGLPAPDATCVATARQQAGPDHTLDFVATLRYDAMPALVVVESTAPSAGSASAGSASAGSASAGSVSTTAAGTTVRRLAIVMARSDCRTLTRTTF